MSNNQQAHEQSTINLTLYTMYTKPSAQSDSQLHDTKLQIFALNVKWKK